MNVCYICGNETEPYKLDVTGPGVRIPCQTCGIFRISERVIQDLQQRMIPATFWKEAVFPGMPRESGAIRELVDSGADVFVESLDDLLAAVSIPQDPLDAIDKIIMYIYRRTTSAAEYVKLEVDRDYSVAYAHDKEEFSYLLEKAIDLKLLEPDEYDDDRLRLTLDGWQRVRELRKAGIDSRQAFVAMWFDAEVQPAFTDGIRPALEAAGYQVLRIDMAEHNDKIDDRIIAEIRKSAVLVADVTGQRPGVYFEAGFAMGLGLPVIWTCKNTDLQNVHFDTRQYNHIVWADPKELRDKLKARVEATLPIWSAGRRSTSREQ